MWSNSREAEEFKGNRIQRKQENSLGSGSMASKLLKSVLEEGI